ncbi:MAG: Restriction endonuclease subunit [Verrucomicrobia bacterium]|nr:Restriction endonuclease subunit [Verrucomicrobiota bacterium]
MKRPTHRAWPTVRLKYVASMNDEALGEDTPPGFELEYVDIGNVDSEGRIGTVAKYRFEDAPSRARRKVRNGDVIISTVRTYLQAIATIKEPTENLIVSTGFAVVRPKSGALLSSYCQFALREQSFLVEMIKRSVGISYPTINISDLGDIRIALPPLEDQRSIARFLTREIAAIDRLIAEKGALKDLLTEKRKAFAMHAVQGGVCCGPAQKETWFGMVPNHWKLRRAAYLFTERDERNEPTLPLMEVSINHGVVVRQYSEDKIEGTAADFNSYKVARQGDIVFNKMRMWQGAVGVAPVDGLTSPDYVVAVPSDEILPEFAGQLFRTERFSAECARRSNGITWDRLRLYWEGFREILIPVPTIAEQRAIVRQINVEANKIDKLWQSSNDTVVLLRERRRALISEAVNGKLDVSLHEN